MSKKTKKAKTPKTKSPKKAKPAKKTLALAGVKVKRELLVDLTEKERKEYGTLAAKADRQIVDLQIEVRDLNTQIKDLAKKRHEYLTRYEAKKETRVVEAVQVKNFEKKRLEFWHDEKLLHSEPLSVDDRQPDMPLDPVKKAGAIKQKLVKEKQLTGAQKAYAKSKHNPTVVKTGTKPTSDIADTIKQETSRRTKRSAVDGVYHSPVAGTA